MSFVLRTLRIALALTAITTSATAIAHAESPSGFAEYVALGDSWAADAVTNPALMSSQYVPIGCAQSGTNFAKQVAAALAVPKFFDASCANAETADMAAPQRGVQAATGPIAAQFDHLTPSTDLVTMLLGGNDAGLAVTVMTCLTGDPTATPCRDSFVRDGIDRMSANIAAAEPKLDAVVRGIRERAPHARILVLNYFKIAGTTGGCFPTVPISNDDAIWLGNRLAELNTMVARVAQNVGVELVDTYSNSDGHDVCQAPGVRWGEGVLPDGTTPAGPSMPFHPNQLGADHQARSVLAALGPR